MNKRERESMQPKVSILTVCFNSAKTIEDTIKSVIMQDYSNIEYILIDGKSTDNTLEVIQKYKGQLSRIISEKDKGMYDGLNKGLKLATGEIIGILNADDFYTEKNIISSVVDKLAKEKTDALYGDLYYVEEKDTDKVKRYWRSGAYRPGAFIRGWMPPHPTFFVKKEIYDRYGGFNLELRSAADYELMLRFIHKHKIKLSYLEKVMVKMRVGGMSNANLQNRYKANREDKKAWELNGLTPRKYTFWLKPLRKIGQFIKKKGS